MSEEQIEQVIKELNEEGERILKRHSSHSYTTEMPIISGTRPSPDNIYQLRKLPEQEEQEKEEEEMEEENNSKVQILEPEDPLLENENFHDTKNIDNFLQKIQESLKVLYIIYFFIIIFYRNMQKKII